MTVWVKRRARRVSKIKSERGLVYLRNAQRHWRVRVSFSTEILNLTRQQRERVLLDLKGAVFFHLGSVNWPRSHAVRRALNNMWRAKLVRCRDPTYIIRNGVGKIIGRGEVVALLNDDTTWTYPPFFDHSCRKVLEDADHVNYVPSAVSRLSASAAETLSTIIPNRIISTVLRRASAKQLSNLARAERQIRRRLLRRWKFAWVSAEQVVSSKSYVSVGKHYLVGWNEAIESVPKLEGPVEASLGLLSSRCQVCRGEVAYGLIRNTRVHRGVCSLMKEELKDWIFNDLLVAGLLEPCFCDVCTRCICPETFWNMFRGCKCGSLEGDGSRSVPTKFACAYLGAYNQRSLTSRLHQTELWQKWCQIRERDVSVVEDLLAETIVFFKRRKALSSS